MLESWIFREKFSLNGCDKTSVRPIAYVKYIESLTLKFLFWKLKLYWKLIERYDELTPESIGEVGWQFGNNSLFTAGIPCRSRQYLRTLASLRLLLWDY